MEHTKGKWKYEEDVLSTIESMVNCKDIGIKPSKYKHYSVFQDGLFVAYCGCHKKTKANAERICKCVNGWDELVKQRDELLEACKAVKDYLTNGFEPDKALVTIERAINDCK